MKFGHRGQSNKSSKEITVSSSLSGRRVGYLFFNSLPSRLPIRADFVAASFSKFCFASFAGYGNTTKYNMNPSRIQMPQNWLCTQYMHVLSTI